ncbi:MAG: GH92 family glycosyl hydrolase [Marinilabiliales bacterium]|nr:GH92 family glycosyl hydrolase [Marinilabiliales bacterium]
MKLLRHSTRVWVLIVLWCGCISPRQSQPADLCQWVDPMIGTGGHGHTFPGTTVPFGMVQISPDTRWEDGSSGYHFSDHSIMGFSQTHLSGTGAPEYCDVLLMPTTGKVRILPSDAKVPGSGYRSSFRHENEQTSPGYYSVQLDDYPIKVELTATARAGFHRYTFPASDSANIILDLKNRDQVLASSLRIISNTEIEGLRKSRRWAPEQYVYFRAKFSKPFVAYGIAVNDTLRGEMGSTEGKNLRAYFRFKTSAHEPILVKIGISAVDTEGAAKNLEAEIPGWDFDAVAAKARTAWNELLSKIEVKGGTDKQKRIFYTSFYHSAIAPNLFQDVDNRYRGIDHRIHTANGFTNYTVFSLWDTFRANMPLYSILDPERYKQFVQTFLEMYKVGGVLPQWELAGNNTAVMIGYHTHSVILDALTKGIQGVDYPLALEAMRKRVENIGYYKDLGFIPADKVGGSVSMVMEYCFNDWCVAQMAKRLNQPQVYHDFMYRSGFYQNLYDPSTGFMRPKKADGQWVSPFDPAEGSEHFVEGNAYQYSLFAPHDVNGLMQLMGGEKAFIQWMDTLFVKKSVYDSKVIDAAGLIGQYAHGNEPSHHMVYLYNYAGVPSKAAPKIRRILTSLYDDQPDGLSGNEDCGQMSAWYILSAMGFYPVCPGSGDYVIGSPLFDEVTLHLGQGKNFTIRALHNSEQNKYIKSARLNGVPYAKSWFSHQEIRNGSLLELEMTRDSTSDWGRAISDRPISTPREQAAPLPVAETKDGYFLDKATVVLHAKDSTEAIHYTLDGSRPDEKSPLYQRPVVVDQSTILRFAGFLKGMLPSLPVSVSVTKLPYEPLPIVEKRDFKSGLHYQYYEAYVLDTEELDPLTPVSTGIVSTFSLEKREREDNFGIIYSGFLDIPRDGIYTFSIKVNDQCVLWLGGKEFIRGGSRTIALKKGKYPVLEKYFQLGAKKFNQIFWEGPGIDKEEIPATALFH